MWTHYTLKQTIIYSMPDKNSKIAAYLRSHTLLADTKEVTGSFTLVVTEHNKVGYIDIAVLEPYTNLPIDLAEPTLRWPADNEIADTFTIGRPPQHISLARIGVNQVHRNLCGPFCCAALLGQDVLPTLVAWRDHYPRAKSILATNAPTGDADLNAIFAAHGKPTLAKINFVSPSPSGLAQLTPAIIGVGIDSSGKVAHAGTIRHWVILLEVLPVAHTAWTRLYNPYWNREEIVIFSELPDPSDRLTVLPVAFKLEA